MQLDTPIGDFILTTSSACASSAERAPGFPRVILVSLTTSQACKAASGWDRRNSIPGQTQSDLGKLGGRQEVTHGVSLQTALNLDPFMIHETFLCLTETAFGSHPCRVVSVTYRKLRPFHGGNMGSNPIGDAKVINKLRSCWFWRTTGYATVQLLDHSTMGFAFLFRHSFVVDIHRD